MKEIPRSSAFQPCVMQWSGASGRPACFGAVGGRTAYRSRPVRPLDSRDNILDSSCAITQQPLSKSSIVAGVQVSTTFQQIQKTWSNQRNGMLPTSCDPIAPIATRPHDGHQCPDSSCYRASPVYFQPTHASIGSLRRRARDFFLVHTNSCSTTIRQNTNLPWIDEPDCITISPRASPSS